MSSSEEHFFRLHVFHDHLYYKKYICLKGDHALQEKISNWSSYIGGERLQGDLSKRIMCFTGRHLLLEKLFYLTLCHIGYHVEGGFYLTGGYVLLE